MTLFLLCGTAPVVAEAPPRTVVAISGEAFTINGRPTYEGRTWQGHKVQGLLINTRMVQGVFDDENPETRGRWAYPDTGRWDAERNTREFMAAMPSWRANGILSFTINFQGGSPEGYSKGQPWRNSAFTADGRLKKDFASRMARILDFADQLGMVPIVGLFYFGQDQLLRDERAIKRAVSEATRWLLARGYQNVLLEIANEVNASKYDHAILRGERVHELILQARAIQKNGRRLLVGTSYGGGIIPQENVVRASDFLLIHGNGVKDPAKITDMLQKTRAVPGYRPMPILFNEDDHFDFDQPVNNFIRAIEGYASWGYFDPGASNYRDGFQCPPIDWTLNTPLKQGFARLSRQITGAP